MVLKFALLFPFLSTSRNILSMQNYCMCFSMCFSSHSVKSHTLPWHTHSCITLSLTSVLAFPCCLPLHSQTQYQPYIWFQTLAHPLCCFIHTLLPRRDAVMPGDVISICAANPKCDALLRSSHRNNTAGNLVSLQALCSWCERAIPKASLRKHKMAQLNFTGIDVIALWNEWKLF